MEPAASRESQNLEFTPVSALTIKEGVIVLAAGHANALIVSFCVSAAQTLTVVRRLTQKLRTNPFSLESFRSQ
jgi:hypothetical protein